jgi:hypothetical protein
MKKMDQQIQNSLPLNPQCLIQKTTKNIPQTQVNKENIDPPLQALNLDVDCKQ